MPNSFYETALHEKLSSLSIKNLVVCGMMTHMCVDTSVRVAKDFGYNVTLIADACATKDLEWNGRKLPASFINDVYMASLKGKFAEVMTSTDYFTVN
ncbi:isochorismatase family protein [[Clostridium] innocuum]|nr:isochorismatase family protein [[Clostridium] innocuum]MCR0579090.1 isochorismatase family protein [[Clostridium] innocuum]